jgi:hypothetical protein
MSVVELAAKRHQLMALFNSKEADDEAIDGPELAIYSRYSSDLQNDRSIEL